MDELNITSAQYKATDGENSSIVIVSDGNTLHVPIAPGNRHYDEIMRQQSEGLLTIADAD